MPKNKAPKQWSISGGMLKDIYTGQRKSGEPYANCKVNPAFDDALPVNIPMELVDTVRGFDGQMVDVTGGLSYSENKFGVRIDFSLETIAAATK